jgi:hypothetical protein
VRIARNCLSKKKLRKTAKPSLLPQDPEFWDEYNEVATTKQPKARHESIADSHLEKKRAKDLKPAPQTSQPPKEGDQPRSQEAHPAPPREEPCHVAADLQHAILERIPSIALYAQLLCTCSS